MKAISTCWNRNDFDLTVIYISIWVERPQWELPYILCESQEWRWGSLSTLYTCDFRNYHSSLTVFVMILSSVQFQEKDFLLQKQTIRKYFILTFFHIYSNSFELFTLQCFSPGRPSLFNSDGLP